MKIAVLGAGAMGSLVGAHLKKGGQQVFFVDPYEAHMKAVQEKGITMDLEGREEETVRIDAAVTKGWEVGCCDLVILLVKGMNTERIILENPELFGDHTVVIFLQNGIGNADTLAGIFPRDRIGYGVLKSSATLTKPGKIKGRVKFPYSSKGVWFSPLEKNTRYAYVFHELEKALNQGGFPAALSEETEKILWDKLYINVLYNAPCALLQLAGEDFMREEDGKKLLKELAGEVCRVANAKGIPMDEKEYWEKECENISQVPKGEHHFTSMVLDVFYERPTEVEFLNGAVCRDGKKLGISTPYNEAVYYLMKVRQKTYSLIYGKQ